MTTSIGAMGSELVDARGLRTGWLIALAQAGRLLSDALILYSERRYPSAVALAVFCREETGRAKLLADLASRAASGEAISREIVMRTCEEHLRKLKNALTGTTIELNGEEGVRIFSALRDRNHPRHEDVRNEVNRRRQRVERQMPESDHRARKRSLYVDLGPDGSWNDPSQMTRAEAYAILNQAAGDYALWRDEVLTSEPIPEDVRAWLGSNSLPLSDFPVP